MSPHPDPIGASAALEQFDAEQTRRRVRNARRRIAELDAADKADAAAKADDTPPPPDGDNDQGANGDDDQGAALEAEGETE